jgi:hypothetical protein
LDIQNQATDIRYLCIRIFKTEDENENEDMPFDHDMECGLYFLVHEHDPVVRGNETG